MQEKENRTLGKERIVIVAAMILIFAAVLVFTFMTLGSGDNNTDFSKRYSEYNENWILSTGEQTETVNFPLAVKIDEGQTITLSKTLPDEIPQYTAIATRNYHQVMNVYVDGELIYTYPNNPTSNFSILSDAWSIINLAPEYSGKTLEITLEKISHGEFTGYISDIYIGDSNSVIQNLRSQATLPFLSGVVLVILGLLLLGLSVIYRKYTNQKPNAPIGLAMMFFGVWLMNRSKIPYFSSSNGRVFFLSLISLLLVPAFLFLFDYLIINKKSRIPLFGSIGCFLFAIFVIITSSTIHYNAEHLAVYGYLFSLIPILHIAIVTFISSFGRNSEYKNKSELMVDRTEIAATIVLLIGAALEAIINHDQLWTEVSPLFRVITLIFAAVYIGTIFWRLYLATKERAIVEKRLQESQLELMMGQIQPHFIFNTLSSIRTLVKTDPDTAYDMLYDFSKYLRANVDNMTNLDGIEFSAEVEHIKSYANIEKIRYGDRLTMKYEIEVDDFTVPPLSIQPLVENAIKHGVSMKPEGGTVTLKSYKKDIYNVVEIDDTGSGMSLEAASSLFCIKNGNEDGIGMESNKMMIEAIEDIVKDLKLLDEDGNPMELSGPATVNDGKDEDCQHKSAGMMNIILRLREMANAKIQISSQLNSGTNIKVFFPIDE